MNIEKPSYAFMPYSKPLLWKTIGGLVSDICERYPGNDALVSVPDDKRYTYGEFYKICRKAAKSFMKLGVKRGDRIAILATNHPEWVITQFSLPMTGGVLVTVNPAFQEHELEYLLKDSDSKGLLLMERFKKSEYLKMFYNICPEAKGSKAGELNSAKLPLLKNIIFLGNESKEGTFKWSDFLELGKDITDEQLDERMATLDPDDVINMQYTSGTTGFPKGVCLTHHNIVNNGYFVGENMRFTDKDRLCIPVPFFHCFGMVLSNLACVTHGSTMVIPSESFEAEKALYAVQKERCTAINGVPTMFIAELDHPEFRNFDLKSLRTGIMAGAPCPIEVMKKVNDLMNMKEVTICYGLTEASPVTNLTKPDDPIELRITTVGAPSPFVEIKIVDIEGNIVPVGKQGEICSRGYQVMKGYYKREEATRDAIDPNGWLHSGDLGVMDENGYCKVTGRIKEMIIRGGENIYPREIEEYMHTHPKVKNAQVFGVPSEKFGEEVAVWIQLTDGAGVTEQDILDFCKGKIAHYKIPKYIKFVNDYPMTASGKIKKFEMKEMAIKELGLASVKVFAS